MRRRAFFIFIEISELCAGELTFLQILKPPYLKTRISELSTISGSKVSNLKICQKYAYVRNFCLLFDVKFYVNHQNSNFSGIESIICNLSQNFIMIE